MGDFGPTTMDDLRTAIQQVLDRDGKHDWDETARLTDIVAGKVWNELHEFPFADSLDAAWAEAEAALPEGCTFDGVRRSALGMKDEWVASYNDEGGWFNFYGPTPAAACRALAAKLREVGR